MMTKQKRNNMKKIIQEVLCAGLCSLFILVVLAEFFEVWS